MVFGDLIHPPKMLICCQLLDLVLIYLTLIFMLSERYQAKYFDIVTINYSSISCIVMVM